jgi:hypothetical protein
MSENEKLNMGVNSAECKQGAEAGPNSEEDTRNWQVGNELGQELKNGVEAPVEDVPLFLRDGSGGQNEVEQDEKDGMGE